MLLELHPDLEFLRETTAKFLTEQMPVNEVRRLRDEPAGFDTAYWRRGADLGWTSLLVDEADGGGSISGEGLMDLAAVAFEFGRHAGPGPLVSVNVVLSALTGRDPHRELIGGLLTGDTFATWCHEEGPPNDQLESLSLTITVDGDELVLNGQKRPVESADVADHLLVSGQSPDGPTQALVPADTPGVSLRALTGVDLTRRFFVVTFDNVRVPINALVGSLGDAAADLEHQLHIALVILNAESVGTMQRAFDITAEWALDRYSFGRPIASYQAIKHRFADMKTWLEAGHAISDVAAQAVTAGQANAGELVSAAKAFIGDRGSELMQECVQFHGGIGLTFEHDLHLYLRRQTLNRVLLGTPTTHRQRIARLTIQREEAS